MNLILDNIIFSLQNSGGISVVWYELLKRILNDHEFNPYFFDGPNKNIFRDNLTIDTENLIKNPYSLYPINIQRFINPNLLNEKGIFHSSYYRITKNPKCINITTVHDFTYENFISGLTKLIHQYQKGVAIKNSKRIICVSQNTKEDLFKLYPQTDQNKITVIYNGADSAYHPLEINNESELKNLVNFSSGEFVLFVGDRNNIYKNFNIAVTACRIAKLPLVLVGGANLNKRENSYLTRELGPNQFIALQNISNNQLNLLYNHSLCLLYPSISEGFGIPIIEAQRAGCPVISTNYSSIPEVAGKGAILLNEVSENQIADALNLIKNDSKFVSSLREEGFKNSLRFSWDKCYQETKQLYKEVYQDFF